MRATDGLQPTITLGPVKDDVRHSRSNCRWRCPCLCHNRTSISPTRSRRSPIRPVSQSSAGSSKSSTRRPTKNWSCSTGTATAASASSAGGHAPSPSRRSSARSPFSGRGSATITTARWRSRRRPHGTRPTNSPSPRISETRSVIRGAINRRGRAAPTSARTLGTRICWGGARSSTSCIRRASS